MSYVLEGKKIHVNGLQFHVVAEGAASCPLTSWISRFFLLMEKSNSTFG
ncbi:hypothetical protein NDK43_20345 [Neobacillus pocheonensis]|uniref:Uncharacterized protein n=1 Tax=Neobacillus pocheonensis TaxID=363869 RepID=A0ABT0WDD3_9BACI|nr:hypothetical protein [Neobacillus pocheonensis]